MEHILSTKQFRDKELLEGIFEKADEYKAQDQRHRIKKAMRGKIMAAVFYEPSTRTRFSFESAMLKLGGKVVSTDSAGQFSSAVKGETLEDSVKIVSGYSDVVVLRHPENGAAKRAAAVSDVPLINAGDGSTEHPTQALLDLYTIGREKGKTDYLNIALVGDLLYGRTIHSLIALLTLNTHLKIDLVAPEALRLPKKYRNELQEADLEYFETEDLNRVIAETDVLYMTRIQKERFKSAKQYKKLKDCFVVDKKMLGKMKDDAIVMHPLPRVKEISRKVDRDPRAAYFRQAKNGLYVRMALLDLLLNK